MRIGNHIALAALATLGIALGSAANAAVIVDDSPDALGGSAGAIFGNQAGFQNFLVEFKLGSATGLTGMDIYTDANAIDQTTGQAFVALGKSATIRLRNDNSGTPSGTNLDEFTALVDAVDSTGTSSQSSMRRVHVDFSAINLSAGSYFIGLSGTNTNISWSSVITSPGIVNERLLTGENVTGTLDPTQNLPFRLEAADAVAAPEPATLAILGMGFAGLGVIRRRRKT
jgi:hypothetical protein